MTMDEIEKLATKLEHHAQADVRTGRSPEDRHPARIAARAALLRAVEGIVRERDRAESALVARHGGEPLALLAELDEAREALKTAEAERDRLLAERDAANATAQRIAERLTAAESALAAARALVESEQAWGLQYGDARCIWCGASPADPAEVHGDGCEFGALVRVLASPPPAALSTETGVKSRTCDADGCPNPASQVVQVAPGCEYRLCGQCYGQTPDGQEDPTKSKEDPTP